MIKRLIVGIVIGILRQPDFIDQVNKKLDLPGLDEAQERELVTAFLSAVCSALEDVAKPKK